MTKHRPVVPLVVTAALAAAAAVMCVNVQVVPAVPPALAGCPMLPADNIWNTPVDSLPVDAGSDAYINSIGADTGLHPDFGAPYESGGQLVPIGIPYNVVPGTQEEVAMHFLYDDESDPGPYPFPPDARIEGVPDWDPNHSGDRHVLVLDTDNCLLYETWNSWPRTDGGWDAGSGAVFDMNSHAPAPTGIRRPTQRDSLFSPVLSATTR